MTKVKPVEMVLNRNFVFASTSGHSVRFYKDKPVEVPHRLVAEVVAIGAQRVDGKDVIEEEKNTGPAIPTDFDVRQSQILEAIEALVERNQREDWTGQGMPKVASINQELKYKIDKQELNLAWKTRAENIAAQNLADEEPPEDD